MKYLFIINIAILTLVVGCGKKEEPESSVAQKASAPSASQEVQVERETKVITSDIQKMGNALTVKAPIDWANISWDDVSKIPYNDKEKLLKWAAPQINELKEKLAKAAIAKGKLSLANLGDSGWQGAIKSTADALESVRTSSPETWEMARNALITAWDALQNEAEKYIGEG